MNIDDVKQVHWKMFHVETKEPIQQTLGVLYCWDGQTNQLNGTRLVNRLSEYECSEYCL